MLAAYVVGFATAHRGEGIAPVVRPPDEAVGAAGAAVEADNVGKDDAGADDAASDDTETDFAALASAADARAIGGEAEMSGRRTVLERLEALEREISLIAPRVGMMGHNNPPGLIEAEPAPDPRDILDAAAAVTRELEAAVPDVAVAAGGATRLQRIASFLKGARDEAARTAATLRDKAREKFVEVVVTAAGALALVFGHRIVDALQSVVEALARWFQLMIG